MLRGAVLLMSLLGAVSGMHSYDQQNRHARLSESKPYVVKPVGVADATTWTIDASKPLVNVSADLFGIFFEEINHSGFGGLYSQSISNSNFEDGRSIVSPWKPLGSERLTIDSRRPLNGHQPHSLRIQALGQSKGSTIGVTNPGFWGVDVNQPSYSVSFFVRSDSITSLTVSLVNGAKTYATADVDGITREWTKKTLTLKYDPVNDAAASFQFSWQSTGLADESLFLDVVTAFPGEGWKGLPYVRSDLAEMMANIKPAFVRFPGGCYVEGDDLVNRFNWKNSLGPIENRPGHWNLWNYWTEDGLGLYEFLSLIEKLEDPYGNPTRAIWVVNNGISHAQSLTPDQVTPLINDAMDSLEFAMGDPASTEWGRMRADMGHPQPFPISYVAIGNEDCGKPWYEENYKLFYTAINTKYPDIQLISNCEPKSFKEGAKTQVWDFHIYTSPDKLAAGANTFDGSYYRNEGAKIFNSEYAVTTGAGKGNLIAAIAEAAWMTGLERNSDLVTTASYAPLFVNQADYTWSPDAIVFNSQAVYGTPSYWNQVLWSTSFNGLVSGSVQTLAYQLDPTANVTVAVSVGKANSALQKAQAGANLVLIHKLVNLKADAQPIDITINNLPAGATLNPTLDVVTLAGSDPNQENSMADPEAIKTVPSTLTVTGPSFSTTLPPYSATVVRAYATTN